MSVMNCNIDEAKMFAFCRGVRQARHCEERCDAAIYD